MLSEMIRDLPQGILNLRYLFNPSEDVEQAVVYVNFEFRINDLAKDINLVASSLEMAFKTREEVQIKRIGPRLDIPSLKDLGDEQELEKTAFIDELLFLSSTFSVCFCLSDTEAECPTLYCF